MVHLLKSKVFVFSLLTTAILLGCGGGSGSSEVDVPAQITSKGRLVLTEKNAQALRVLSLDSSEILATFNSEQPISALQSSPNQRYAVVIQRTTEPRNDQVQFVDGGLWQEDHADHLHDYEKAPSLLNYRVMGPVPTHFETHKDHAALFMDGSAAQNMPAQVVVLSDASIGKNASISELTLPVSMHGVAEVRGKYVLVPHREPTSDSTLPSHVDLYAQDGAKGLRKVQSFDVPCERLHGSFSNKNHTAFGCSDGVLVISQVGDVFTARKALNPVDMPENARIGTVVGHFEQPLFIGVYGGKFYSIDPEKGDVQNVNWALQQQLARSYKFDASGAHLVVLDDQGQLQKLAVNNQWASQWRIPVISNMPTEAPFPGVQINQSMGEAYVGDLRAKAVLRVDLKTGEIGKPIALNFAPEIMTWVGIKKRE